MRTSLVSTVRPVAAAPAAGAALLAPPPMDFRARAGEAAELLKALANPDRLMLLCQLVGAERTVTELGVLARIEQPSLSQQLGVLRAERLVATRRAGKNVHYRIDSPSALKVLETLYGLFCVERPRMHAPRRTASAGGVTLRRKETE